MKSGTYVQTGQGIDVVLTDDGVFLSIHERKSEFTEPERKLIIQALRYVAESDRAVDQLDIDAMDHVHLANKLAQRDYGIKLDDPIGFAKSLIKYVEERR